ncbi:transposase [Sporosarcina sp. P7]|nr:transposase [Sporosarcina sp. P7]
MKGYKYKIHPNVEQQKMINQTIGCARFVYNHILFENLERRKRSLPWLSKFDAIKILPELKKSFEWLKEADSIALQSSIEYLYQGFKRYNKMKKVLHKKTVKKYEEINYIPTEYDNLGHPRFKNKKHSVQSYTTKNSRGCIEIKENRIKLPKLGWVRFSKSRDVEGIIKRVTVSKSRLGKYSVSIICELAYSPYKPAKNESIGIDLGITNLLVLSNGEIVRNPKTFQSYKKRLAFLQRALARKQEGSKSWEENKRKITKVHQKIKCFREDFLQKLSTRLIHENQVIGLESLQVKSMVKEKQLSEAIHDASWSKFVNMLNYKANWYGRIIISIDSFFASSQLCSECGFQNKEIKNLKIRSWVCPSCRAVHDRDLNAAKNIKIEAIRLYKLERDSACI